LSDEVKIFFKDSETRKILGEVLGNKTGSRIVDLLIEKEFYTQQLANEMDIPVSGIIHHLRKLEKLNLVDITHKPIVKKGIDRRVFRIKKGIHISTQTQEEAEKSGLSKRIFRESVKFTSLAGVAFLAWLQLKPTINSKNDGFDYGDMLEISFYQESTFVPMLIIICGLIINTIFLYKKKKKRSIKI